MILKHVSILKNGSQIYKFDCAVCDFTENQLIFNGVVNKQTGYCDHNIAFRHIGPTYIEIDRANRECIIIPEQREIQMLVTW